MWSDCEIFQDQFTHIFPTQMQNNTKFLVTILSQGVCYCVLLRWGYVSLTILTFLPHSIHPEDILHFPNAKGYEQNHKKLSILRRSVSR